jgi:SAF domain
MTSTMLTPRRRGAKQPQPVPSLVAGGARRRRWPLAMLAVLVTLGSALTFVVLWMNAGGREPVLAVRRAVAAGQIIKAEDLSVVRVAVDPGIEPLDASARDDVIGRSAATDLLAGSLLIAAAVGDDEGLESGTAVVAVPVPSEELPSVDLEAGDRVLLYQGLPAEGDGRTTADTIGDARVFAIHANEEGAASISVSVIVDEGVVPDVAAAIQSDRIYMALAANRR